MFSLQAHPTQRKKTTITFLPPPKVSSLSRSSGAVSPTFGLSAIGMGGGTGVNQGWTVNGRDFTVIQAGQAGPSLSGADFLDESESDHGRLNDLFDKPTFLRATFVARLENIVFWCGPAIAQTGRGVRSRCRLNS